GLRHGRRRQDCQGAHRGRRSVPEGRAADEGDHQQGVRRRSEVTEADMVILHTNKGAISVELDAAKAPKSVANFLQYVRDGHYDNTVFNRVIDDFMIQGGGMEPGMKQKPTRAGVDNEAANGLKNNRYTLAMARTSDPHSATAQFFINVNDNDFLNHTAPTE